MYSLYWENDDQITYITHTNTWQFNMSVLKYLHIFFYFFLVLLFIWYALWQVIIYLRSQRIEIISVLLIKTWHIICFGFSSHPHPSHPIPPRDNITSLHWLLVESVCHFSLCISSLFFLTAISFSISSKRFFFYQILRRQYKFWDEVFVYIVFCC